MRKHFKFLILACGLALAGCATQPSISRAISSADPYLSNIGLGPSSSTTDPAFHLSPDNVVVANGGGPSRVSGGELFKFFVVDANKKPGQIGLIGLRLIGLSKSGKGAVLVRSVSAVPAAPTGLFDPLTSFASIGAGAKAENHNGNVLLANGDSVIVNFDAPLNVSALSFVLEGFANDDASVVIQFSYATFPKDSTMGLTRMVLHPPGHEGNSGSGESGEGSVDHGPRPGCHGDGITCFRDSDCCHGGCHGGLCGKANNCTPDGVRCSSSGQCCSNYCQGNVCGGSSTCTPDGVACSNSGQCCTNYCQGGRCGGTSVCIPNGAPCKSSGDCCSNTCMMNKCM